ncbi:phage tail tape measure protein [Marinobacter sp. X15-166B]|uniref:phage tail tape measure protein n=1 Tax=Marinobacter sp. X15-166B TaxID=1897620 RepID=UPI00085C1BBF|nr:hypothetical protein [Marinobacter sp. X15-166B]OEY67450.1 hypothetical protein BG841_14090 [Marinobacter sp. X15-166B]
MSKSLDLQVILAARDKITGPLKKINATSSGTAQALKQAQAETRKLQSTQRDISSYRKADKALKDNSAALSASQERVRQLGKELTSTAKPTAKLRNEYNRARKEVEQFTSRGQKQRKELGAVRKRLQEAGVSTHNLADAERKLADQMKVANERIQRQRQYLDRLGKADVGGKFNNMTSEVTRFGKRALVATTGVAAGIFGIANSTAGLGDHAAKTADKLKLTTAAYQELSYAGERSGISQNAMDGNMQRFVKRTGEAVRGAGAAQQAYEALGLSAEDLANMQSDEALAVVADRLSSVTNHNQKVDIASQLFGTQGGAAMLNLLKDGSAGLQQLRADAQRTGYVLSEKTARDAETFKDALLDTQLSMAGMKNTIGAELMPAVTELMGDLSSWMGENRDQVKQFAREFGDRLKNALPIIRDIGTGVASTAKNLAMMTSRVAGLVGGFDNLGMILAFIFAMKPIFAILAFGKAIFTATTAIIGLAGGLPMIAAGIKAVGLAITANPIGLLISAIAGAGYLIYKNWDGIAGFFSGLWGQVTAAFSAGIGGIGKLILNWSPLGLFYKAFSGVMGWFGVDLPESFTGFGKQILDGLVNGILGGLNKVKDTITGAGAKAIGWFKETLGIKSPSRVFMGAGHDTLEGYRKGLEQQEPDTLKQVTGFGKRVRQAGAGIAIGAAALPAAADGIQFDSRAPIGSPTASASAAAGDSVTINVYGAPGQDAQEIAAQVERILQDRDRRNATRARSALYDRD